MLNFIKKKFNIFVINSTYAIVGCYHSTVLLEDWTIEFQRIIILDLGLVQIYMNID